jgi:hypothetical protein
MSFSATGALSAVSFPVTGCYTGCSGCDIVRHLNTQHLRLELSEGQHDSVWVKQFSCGKRYSATRWSRHKCFPGDHSRCLTGQKRRLTGLDDICTDGQVGTSLVAQVGAGEAGLSNRLHAGSTSERCNQHGSKRSCRRPVVDSAGP